MTTGQEFRRNALRTCVKFAKIGAIELVAVVLIVALKSLPFLPWYVGDVAFLLFLLGNVYACFRFGAVRGLPSQPKILDDPRVRTFLLLIYVLVLLLFTFGFTCSGLMPGVLLETKTYFHSLGALFLMFGIYLAMWEVERYHSSNRRPDRLTTVEKGILLVWLCLAGTSYVIKLALGPRLLEYDSYAARVVVATLDPELGSFLLGGIAGLLVRDYLHSLSPTSAGNGAGASPSPRLS